MRRLILAMVIGILAFMITTPLGLAQDYNVQINFSDDWTAAKTVFDYTNSNGAINCVGLLNVDHDGNIRYYRSEGGKHNLSDLSDNNFPATVDICDSLGWFYNGLVIDFDSLGTEITFDIKIDPATSGMPGTVDQLAFYLLGGDGRHPFQTADPLGANALFILSLNDDESVDLTVFSPMTAVGNLLSLTLDSTAVDIPDVPIVQGRLRLLSVEPNPPHSNVQILYTVSAPGSRVKGHIYDFQGQLVKVLLDREQQPGEARITWNGADETGRDVEPGVYFVQLTTAGHSVIRKVVLVR